MRKQSVRIIYCLKNGKNAQNTLRSMFSFFDKLVKIRHHHCKKRLKISKIARFESNLLKPKEDIAPPQRRKIFTHVRLYGGEKYN